MRHFYFQIASAMVAVSGIALTSCTDKEEADAPDYPADNAIRFAATTEFTRAGDITTNNLTSFNVYAYTGTTESPNLFMDNVTVSKGSGNAWTYSPVEYWPANESVDFYAFSPAGWVNSKGPLSASEYDAYPGTQDIVYAVAPDQRGSSGMANAQVILNFRHALSKATIKMRSSDANLTVKVSNVIMANIMTKGNFRFPSESTSDAIATGNVGTWTDQNTPNTYVFHMSQAPDDLIILSTTPTDMGDTGLGLGGAKFMMPQTLTYRSNGSGNDTYIAVMCSIYDAKSGAKLWPNANTPAENVVEGSTFGDGLLKFPLSTSKFSAWQPGVHYIYNLVINANDEMGAIEFGNPTVDSFIEVISNYE